MEDNTTYTGIGRKTLAIIYVIVAAVCCLAGLALHSFGLFADGVLTLLFLSELLRKNEEKAKLSRVISIVGLVLGGYATVAGFFNLSATIGYADASASIYVFPLFALVLLTKVALVAFSEGGTQDRADAVFGLIVTLLVIVGTVATFLEGHYFEPAVAASIGVYSVYKSVKNIFGTKDTPTPEPDGETTEG